MRCIRDDAPISIDLSHPDFGWLFSSHNITQFAVHRLTLDSLLDEKNSALVRAGLDDPVIIAALSLAMAQRSVQAWPPPPVFLTTSPPPSRRTRPAPSG